ncbi:hypothetical protein L873DRAFT_1828869 [Choiromyces venosus 120613-1]|uniref:RRM domain-containing protein n=1 Tax=Choiromyces venosus 120613-1 TaxID=1336337 RepID=A0A3N4JM60_9PEZI|nr:hypothetical protein L873DRAFT_1828869 [Choiromyces venosus 120613-1]
MSTTVTIDKIYFETLLRKANVHGSEPDHNGNTNVVTVTRDYHEDLVKTAKEYKALRTALIRGGVTVENLELLINAGLDGADVHNPSDRNGHGNSHPLPTPSENGGVTLNCDQLSSSAVQSYPTTSSTSFRTQPQHYTSQPSHGYTSNGFSRDSYREPDDYAGSDGTEKQDISGPKRGGVGGGGNDYKDDSVGNRTLFFSRLPEKVTYSSFLEAIRGGMVVDAWMKPGDHCGSISFLHPQSAEAFYRYAKKNDVYIDGRRVNVEWREQARQFVVLPNILRQIHSGATRNLHLRNIPSTLTETRLRDDLDHIANLSIEKIVFDKARNSVQVNLNSVCVACFARTCLKSRAYYKGTKIEFGADECAKSLPDFKAYKPKQEPKANPERKISNRFDALALDGGEDDWDASDDAGGTEDWADSVTNGTGKSGGW